VFPLAPIRWSLAAQARWPPLSGNQLALFFGATTFRQPFTTTEQVGHGVAPDGVRLPRGHDGLNLPRGQSLRAEIGVQLDEELFIRHVIGRFLR